MITSINFFTYLLTYLIAQLKTYYLASLPIGQLDHAVMPPKSFPNVSLFYFVYITSSFTEQQNLAIPQTKRYVKLRHRFLELHFC